MRSNNGLILIVDLIGDQVGRRIALFLQYLLSPQEFLFKGSHDDTFGILLAGSRKDQNENRGNNRRDPDKKLLFHQLRLSFLSPDNTELAFLTQEKSPLESVGTLREREFNNGLAKQRAWQKFSARE